MTLTDAIASPTISAPLVPGLVEWAGGNDRVHNGRGVVLELGAAAGPLPTRIVAIPGARLVRGTAYATAGEDAALVRVRVSQAAWMMDVTVGRLRSRTVGHQPLVAMPTVKARLAEAAVRIAEAQAACASSRVALAWAHTSVSDAEAILAELHGGSSVLTSSVGHLAHFSRLLALTFAEVM